MSGKGSGRRPEAEAGNYASGYDRVFAAMNQASEAAQHDAEQEAAEDEDE